LAYSLIHRATSSDADILKRSVSDAACGSVPVLLHRMRGSIDYTVEPCALAACVSAATAGAARRSGAPRVRRRFALITRRAQSAACVRSRRVGAVRRSSSGIAATKPNKQLKRAFFPSAFAALADPASRAYYDKKIAQGKHHTQALLRLARRRADVLFAMLRDGTYYEPRPTRSG